MTELAVITPTHGPDAELFAELHRSVLEHTSDDTVHHVIISPVWRKVFQRYAGPRCRVWTYPELLPGSYLRLGPRGPWVDARRPWPPVRGWVMQQTLKLALTARMDADAVLIADSDVVLVRPVRMERFMSGGRPRLFREPKGVTPDMDRHVLWHRVSRDMLGLPPAPPPPLTDYVTPLNFWDPAVARALQDKVAEIAGRPWLDAFNARLHISEFMLYGVFADEVLPAAERPASDNTLSHNNWQRSPLSTEEAVAFAERLGPGAIAMMISAKSRTGPEARQAAIRRCAEIA
ncbi:hypothetical protein Misp01_39260 [Microtetraspora sp. NBRC 13810]|uniref:DUF6492 family protein n=1 Tax=Microtetraspora sp. NBRC 13810 TaxID=3030990 RepID=UPI002552F314|nr:DUF6492 family protein [Microtetraspora sp. NBRC 13810]GLW08796.1 hypothetical protein Misp01_39260 [Microtetraspora sp. NBRC 13810]